jgi:hypothetical protein
VWQELHEELGPQGLVIIAVALDEDLDAIRYCARDESPVTLTYPVLIDRDHLLAEHYGIVNIPTTIWINEQGRIVRPPAIAPADDKFRDFTKVDSSLHHTALRRWVRDGVTPMTDAEIRARQEEPDADVQQARAERRLAVHLLRRGDTDHAQAHLAAALTLAPNDWTIQRGSMPLRGEDPFGQAFFDFYESWEAAGRPGYGA